MLEFNAKLVIKSYMVYSGIFVGGPANLISSAISADLGKQVLAKNIIGI